MFYCTLEFLSWTTSGWLIPFYTPHFVLTGLTESLTFCGYKTYSSLYQRETCVIYWYLSDKQTPAKGFDKWSWGRNSGRVSALTEMPLSLFGFQMKQLQSSHYSSIGSLTSFPCMMTRRRSSLRHTHKTVILTLSFRIISYCESSLHEAEFFIMSFCAGCHHFVRCQMKHML